MDRISPEILLLIVQQLREDVPKDEYGNMQMVGARDPMLAHLRTSRLVCKDFAAAVEDIFTETYFSTWTVSLEQKSLSDLVAMSNHERLARHVRNLKVSNYALSRAPVITTSDFGPYRHQLALSLEGANHILDKSRLNELLGGDGSVAMKAYNVYKKHRKFVEAPELGSVAVRQLSSALRKLSATCDSVAFETTHVHNYPAIGRRLAYETGLVVSDISDAWTIQVKDVLSEALY